MLKLLDLTPWIGAAGLGAALLVYWYLSRKPAGGERAMFIAGLIEAGAMAFLRRQYLVLLPVLILVAGLLALTVGWPIGAAYIFGGVSSVAAGYLGMTVEVLERIYGHHHPDHLAVMDHRAHRESSRHGLRRAQYAG